MQPQLRATPKQVRFFEENGYLLLEDILSKKEIDQYAEIYNRFLDGTIDTGKNRGDLGDGLGESNKVESITQIMWPSDFLPELLQMPYHRRVLDFSRDLLGKDLAIDFDMMINKAPGTNTPTPWHQDAAYWISMPDTRAVSCWLALDNASIESGCMWYVPGSHVKEIRPHRFAGKEGGALMCECDESEGVPIEIKAGSCVLHHGHMLHYSRGNSTQFNRRALIVNLRPESMIALEREKGHDHGRGGKAADRQIRNEKIKS
jgi:phytanoyl-CoA hydroxylase